MHGEPLQSTAPPFSPPVPAPHPAPPAHPELPDGVEPTRGGPHWKAWTAWVALIAGFGAAIAGAIIISIGAAAFGAALDDPPPAVNILATVVQDLCLIGAAIFMARIAGTPRPADFGLRPTPFWRAVGWAVLTWVAFLLFTAAFVSLVGAHNTDESLPDDLGAKDSTLALLAVGVLVCVVAPIAEEFFFRGYFFTALRSWKGMWPAALITGLVFGGIHAGSADIAFLVPLAVFGTLLCLLYVKTGSIYPTIATHAVNNCVAFGSSQDWGWEIVPAIVVSLALIAGIIALVQARARAVPALG